MRVVVTGGEGFLGRRLAARLLERADLESLVLFDKAPGAMPLPPDARLARVTGDIADPATVGRLIAPGTDAVFHLAAIVSGEAEADPDLGWRVNLDGTRAVLEACRALGTRPRLVFASSLAVYGGELPPEVGEEMALTPQTSYGAQKAIGELIVGDYTRKRFIDGRALRLPTVVVRPGRPNRAASGFASSIIREPLAGKEAICPVGPQTVMALISPRRVVAALLHALDLAEEAFGMRRSLQLPAFSVSVGEMAEAVRRAGGEEAYARIRWHRDAMIEAIVAGWPHRLVGTRAEALGFEADAGIDEAVAAFVADDLEAQKALV
ncbi:MAG TPA: D-erythronate dehydrogenase [Stellaceae bacterium]|nr:D-erythronate dehydrogenase [Stellaceae bacterium]